jgi:phospholipase C
MFAVSAWRHADRKIHDGVVQLRSNREVSRKRGTRNKTRRPGAGTIGRVKHSRLLAAGGASLLAATAAVSCAVTPSGAVTAKTPAVPVTHVIEIMIENHSFDNLFGKFPGADGIPANTSLLNPDAYFDSAPDVHAADLTTGSAFFADLASGGLPDFSFVRPGVDYSTEPPEDIGQGDAWIGQLVNAVAHSKYWASTAIFVTYDESGGF